ncbi:MAG: nitroreductase [Rhodobacteraceae bacterium]|nr:nitroreductase [Paracoccaceae bacterium]
MPDPNPTALDFLLSRRSHPAKTLAAPVPGREELERLLTAAARVPDHGMLVPWRFVVLQRAALRRLGELAAARAAAEGLDPERIEKAALPWRDGHLAVAVVIVPRPTEKIPEIEQVLSAGAVCLSLLNAALAAGWGASWITGWAVYDEGFLREGLGLAPGERIAGIIHIASATSAPPERPRPDIGAITTWLEA